MCWCLTVIVDVPWPVTELGLQLALDLKRQTRETLKATGTFEAVLIDSQTSTQVVVLLPPRDGLRGRRG